METIKEKMIKTLIKSRLKNQADLAFFKRKTAKKYKIPCLSNIELLKVYHKLLKNKRIKKSEDIENLLKTRPIRSLSGIVNIAVLTKPYPCPGKCLYCPKEPGIPKSYLSGEPAVERAKRLNFNPYWQTRKRLEMLKNEGHATDKIELRIIGGTWSYYPKRYQEWFVEKCFQASNEFEDSKNSKTALRGFLDLVPTKKIQNLQKTQKRNEKAKHRIVGLSIETRPDFINEKEIKWLRKLGVTMAELGVQSIYDDVLALNQRGHGIRETILATKLLKDAGFKVLYQIMPNLPGSSLKRDEKMFQELFKNSVFQPDLLKIYPCALLKEAPLYQNWKKGGYKPYSEGKLTNLLLEIKKNVPYYVRIQRITRDIPSPKILAGAKISNLRQILSAQMKKQGWKCRCVRCREIKERYLVGEKICLFRQEYRASGGKEFFLSLETKNRQKLYSLLRLRIPSQAFKSQKHFLPVLKNSAIIREIHTYGKMVPIAKRASAPQHQGLGKRLIIEAEKIAKKEFGLKKIAVIAGIGARDYFRKSGYRLKNDYMIKKFKEF